MPRLLAVFFVAVLIGGCASKSNSPKNARGGTEWDTLNQKAEDLYRKGHYDRGVIVAKKSLELAEKSDGTDHPNVAMSLNILALLYKTQGKYAQAEPLYKRSLAIVEKALGPDHPHVAASLENMAVLYRATKREQEAEKLEQRAARIRAATGTRPR